MKTIHLFGILISIYCFVCCTGPRNIYSASPNISPVPLENGSTTIEPYYFSHARQTHVSDTIPANHDNCFGFNLCHMLGKRTLLFGGAELKKEQNQFGLTRLQDTAYPSYYSYNAGFDSSIVNTKRKTFSMGLQSFLNSSGKNIQSLAASIGWHWFDMNESGLLHLSPYHRRYKLNQLSLSLQYNFLFRNTPRFKLAWIERVTVLKNFGSTTDYSTDEKLKSGLRDRRMNVLIGLLGFYAEYRPFKTIPIYVNSQLFSDLIAWNHLMAHYELGRVYVKGIGVSAGIKCVFK